MKDLNERFRAYILERKFFQPTDQLLVAVSGGLDSVVLCALCRDAKIDFVMAHCNFGLRGDESNRDEVFVHKLAEEYGTKLLVKTFDTRRYAIEQKLSIQVAARQLRYEWFYSLLAPAKDFSGPQEKEPSKHPAFIATGHHLDDQVETLMINFFKGTGIAGLRAMLPKQGKVVRPLLFAKKDELKQFALDRGLHWVEDSSNESDVYTRNLFRLKIMPSIEQIYPGAMENLGGNIARFEEIEILYRQAIDAHKKKLVQQRGSEYHIPVLLLQKAVPQQSIIFEIIRDFGFSPGQVTDVASLLSSETGKQTISPTHRIIKNRGWLIIAPLQEKAIQNILIETGTREVNFEGGVVHISEGASITDPPANAAHIALMDASAVEFPLLLRKWKNGDYFYPLGMGKKKKLSRFLIDQKLSLTEKEKVWVLEMNRKIIWVVGMRLDDRFKIKPTTRSALKMELRMA